MKIEELSGLFGLVGRNAGGVHTAALQEHLHRQLPQILRVLRAAKAVAENASAPNLTYEETNDDWEAVDLSLTNELRAALRELEGA